MLKKIFISTPAAQAREIADILRVASQVPQTTIDVGLGFDSPAQAGQYQRRIREALLEAKVDPEAFSFNRPKDSSALEISFLGIDDDSIDPSEDHDEAPAAAKPGAASPVPATTNGSSAFSEGKASLQDITIAERAGGSYLAATLLIVEGKDKGQSFPESIRRFPPQARLQRFADAFGVSTDDLVAKSHSLIGTQVWFRRRNVTLPDGTSRTETFYYRIMQASHGQTGATK